jgi:hypothetical protein
MEVKWQNHASPLYSKVTLSGMDLRVKIMGSKIGLNVMGFSSPQPVILDPGIVQSA